MSSFIVDRSAGVVDVPQRWIGPLTVLVSLALAIWAWTWREGSLGALALLPIIWARVRPAWAFTAASSYMLVALWPVQPAVLAVFPEWPSSSAYLLWVAFALLSALPWTLTAYLRRKGRLVAGVGMLAVVVLTVVPPWGILAWCHPILAAAWLLPGGGITAVAGLTLAWVTASAARERKSVAAIMLGILAVQAGWALVESEVESAPLAGILTIDTQLKAPTTVEEYVQHVEALASRVEAANPEDGTVVVLPETILGNWGPGPEVTVRQTLGEQARKTPLLMGASFRQDGKRWNGAIYFDGVNLVPVRARQPLPIGMWNPFAPEVHHNADWRARAVLLLGSRRVALRVCSEEFTLFWALVDARLEPDVLLGIGNTWWAVSPVQERTHRTHAMAVGKLMGLPVMRAINHGLTLPSRDEWQSHLAQPR